MLTELEEVMNLAEVIEGVFSVHDKQVYLGHKKMAGLKLKTLRTYGNALKLVVDYGFKGNARYAEDKSDYYLLDLTTDRVYKPEVQNFQVLTHTLDTIAKKETERAMQVLNTETVVTASLTVANMVNDGWHFEFENGIKVYNDEDSFLFTNEKSYMEWLFEKALEY